MGASKPQTFQAIIAEIIIMILQLNTFIYRMPDSRRCPTCSLKLHSLRIGTIFRQPQVLSIKSTILIEHRNRQTSMRNYLEKEEEE